MKKALSLILALIIVVSFCATAFAAEPEITIKFGTSMTTTEYCTQCLPKWFDEIKKLSDGRIVVDYYPSGALGTTAEHMEQTDTGMLDMNMSELGSYQTYVKEIGVLYTAGIVKSYEHQLAIINSDAGKLLQQCFDEESNTYLIAWYPSGARSILAKKPLNSLADMKGLKIRVPGDSQVYIDCFNMMGASPTPLNYSEVYTSLQSGVVDAFECPLPAICDGGYAAVAPYLHITQHFFGNAVVGVNKDFWDKLSKEDQELILQAWDNVKDDHIAGVLTGDEDYIKKMVEEQGATVVEIEDYNTLDEVFAANSEKTAKAIGGHAMEFYELINACK